MHKLVRRSCWLKDFSCFRLVVYTQLLISFFINNVTLFLDSGRSAIAKQVVVVVVVLFIFLFLFFSYLHRHYLLPINITHRPTVSDFHINSK